MTSQAELIHDPTQLPPGQPFYLLQVGRAGAAGGQIVADLTMDLVAPARPEHLAPVAMGGFELPARETLTPAHVAPVKTACKRS